MSPHAQPRAGTAAARDRAEVRGLRALELRLAGRTFPEIASDLGYADRSGAKRAYERALTSMREDMAADVVTHRVIQVMRIERMLCAVWARATDPTAPEQLRAVDTVRRLLERQARLLGLDAPVRSNAVSPEVDAEIEALLDEMGTYERELGRRGVLAGREAG